MATPHHRFGLIITHTPTHTDAQIDTQPLTARVLPHTLTHTRVHANDIHHHTHSKYPRVCRWMIRGREGLIAGLRGVNQALALRNMPAHTHTHKQTQQGDGFEFEWLQVATHIHLHILHTHTYMRKMHIYSSI